jgi:hypothetical protein
VLQFGDGGVHPIVLHESFGELSTAERIVGILVEVKPHALDHRIVRRRLRSASGREPSEEEHDEDRNDPAETGEEVRKERHEKRLGQWAGSSFQS